MIMRRLILCAFVAVLPFSGCNCEDAYQSGWELHDQMNWPDADAADAQADAADVWDAAPDVADAGPDVMDAAVEEDAAPDVEPWQPEEVEPAVPMSQALTDRTSLAVDPRGTLWLGYHACADAQCSRPMLRVVHKPVGGQWSGEDIRQHDGIFGVSVIEPNRPIVAFPDSLDNTYKVAMRQADGSWRLHTFPVERSTSSRSDGFDVTNDGTSYYISFAPLGAPQVEFYGYDLTQTSPRWRRLNPLGIQDPQAAMERGLRADQGDSVYLVNEDGRGGVYGVYRYDEALDRWPQSASLHSYTDLFVHSLVLTSNFQLCMSGNYNSSRNYNNGHLLVTCGSMYDLTQQVKSFPSQHLAPDHPSSIIEGNDGTLYVAFIPDGNGELRVASRAPDSDRWTIETVYDGPSYGVSTAIAKSGDLVMSFYTCNDAQRCSLKVLWETPQ